MEGLGESYCLTQAPLLSMVNGCVQCCRRRQPVCPQGTAVLRQVVRHWARMKKECVVSLALRPSYVTVARCLLRLTSPLALCPAVILLHFRPFQVRYHDIHHWYPECNYGQYTMLWDWLTGSLKPYPEGDDGSNGKASANGAHPPPVVVARKEKAG